jgi:NitT/TauT family transport system ATP-binding protein
MHEDIIISVNSISKTFSSNGKTINAIQKISIDVKQGEFISIFGPNGCGKTTLVNLLAQIDKPSSGSINFNSTNSPKISIVFQDYNNSLMPWKSCLENIFFPLEKTDQFTLQEKEKKVYNILNLLGIKNRLPLKNYPYQMSGGEKQLTSIARALITEPDILLFDEPFVSLDFQTRIEMISIVENIWLKTKKTTIFISHDIDEAIRLADRLLLLSPRPSSILKEYGVSLNRPRTIEIETDAHFIELKNAILKDFTKLIEK